MSESDEGKAKAFLREAYGLVTESDTLAFYERWAVEYDAQLQRGLRYIAPSELAGILAKHQVMGDVPIRARAGERPPQARYRPCQRLTRKRAT